MAFQRKAALVLTKTRSIRCKTRKISPTRHFIRDTPASVRPKKQKKKHRSGQKTRTTTYGIDDCSGNSSKPQPQSTKNIQTTATPRRRSTQNHPTPPPKRNGRGKRLRAHRYTSNCTLLRKTDSVVPKSWRTPLSVPDPPLGD